MTKAIEYYKIICTYTFKLTMSNHNSCESSGLLHEMQYSISERIFLFSFEEIVSVLCVQFYSKSYSIVQKQTGTPRFTIWIIQ